MRNCRLTLCLPYYMNAGMLKLQLGYLRSLPPAILDQLAVIVVDDGSPDGEAQGEPIGCPLTIYRIGVDIRWNQDAARNIAAFKAVTKLLLLTDMDHIVPRETYEAVLAEKLNKLFVYRFSRETLDAISEDGRWRRTPYKPHPNSWLLSSKMYRAIGGYDERFAGHYGTDAEFRDRAAKVSLKIVLRDDTLIRVPRSTIPDASTTTYQRKGAAEDVGAIQRIKAQRAEDPEWKPLVLTFPYTQIYHDG